ncbi:MAG: glycosyltransferase family 39 protein [Phycisphaerales bacterium]|nr:glycosyltransferase family 39 protein [Phycisphaerales bacterium]
MASTPRHESRTPTDTAHSSRAGTLFDVVVLSVVCSIAYIVGLTNHGLTNWQESQRALVAREMQRSGEWLVPTVNQQPYLAKPPMFYWCQLLLARLRGVETGEFELRLTVALSGLFGVLATYWLVRRLMDAHDQAALKPGLGREAALWSGLFLATGPLYVRSSRIGELDIMLVPFVVCAVASIVNAWLSWRERGKVAYGWLALATLSATGAALTKGPPALAVIAAAGYGPMIFQSVLATSHIKPHPRKSWLTRLGLVGGAIAAAMMTVPKVHGLGEAIGALILIALCGWLGQLLTRSLAWANLASLFRAFSRTHPIGVLGVPMLVLWGWGRLVGQRIGAEAAAFWAQKETEDNLNIFIPISPIKNLEAMSFGVGLGSIAALIALVWVARNRPRLSVAWLVPLAWVVLGFAIFSLLGKGIGRYLTPVWPGIAMLGGIGVAHALANDRGAPRVRSLLAGTVIVLAGVSGWWYGYGRERSFAARSPRALVQELRSMDIRTDRLASFEFRTSAIDFYADHRVAPVGDIQIRDVTAGGKPMTIEELRDDIATNGQRIVLMRERQLANDGRDSRSAAERLKALGLTVVPIETSSRFVIDSGKSNVLAARVSVARSATTSPEVP